MFDKYCSFSDLRSTYIYAECIQSILLHMGIYIHITAHLTALQYALRLEGPSDSLLTEIIYVKHNQKVYTV